MEKAAKTYKIKVTDKEIDLELALMRSAQDKFDTAMQNLSAEQLRQKIRSQLILDKVLTKDVVIEEENVEKYYEENQGLYNTKTSYRTNFIEVDSKKAADEALGELKNGSDFTVLAREISVDSASASLGGDIGFLTENQENIDPAIINTVKSLKANEVSKAFKLDNSRSISLSVTLILYVLAAFSITVSLTKFWSVSLPYLSSIAIIHSWRVITSPSMAATCSSLPIS